MKCDHVNETGSFCSQCGTALEALGHDCGFTETFNGKFFERLVLEDRQRKMTINKRIRRFLFKHILPEYAFMPWQTTMTKISGRGHVAKTGRQTGKIYFLKVYVEGVYAEPELSREHWECLHVGEEIKVRYRKSRIHDDIRGGRELQFAMPAKLTEIVEKEYATIYDFQHDFVSKYVSHDRKRHIYFKLLIFCFLMFTLISFALEFTVKFGEKYTVIFLLATFAFLFLCFVFFLLYIDSDERAYIRGEEAFSVRYPEYKELLKHEHAK